MAFYHEPKQPVSRIFEARYYPKEDFINASLGSNPSFVWRSIWESKDLLNMGIRWCVGNGKSINILQQPWLTDVQNPYNITTQVQGLENSKVNSLMNMEGTNWDDDSIMDLFNDHQGCILNIPIRRDRVVDRIYWKG